MSGSATNIGVEFQQRASAYYILHILYKLDVNKFIEITNDEDIPISIYSETTDSIDDFVLEVESKKKIYFQAKRTLSFSSDKDSQFGAVIKQFVHQFIENTNKEDVYVLVTTPRSSTKIVSDLKKIIKSIKMNPEGYLENPFSKNEQYIYDTFKKLIEDIYNQEKGLELGNLEFIAIIKKIEIITLDIEDQKPVETAMLMLIATKAHIDPKLLWNAILQEALILAGRRQSIDYQYLVAKLKKYLTTSSKEKLHSEIPEIMEEIKNQIKSGFDMIIFKFQDKEDLFISRLKRFDKACKRRVKFIDKNKAYFSSGEEIQIILRASSYSRIEKYIEEHTDEYSNNKIIIIQDNYSDEEIEEIQNSDCVLKHDQYLQEKLDSENIDNCLRCMNKINEKIAYFVEIDKNDLPAISGSMHKSCAEPNDRIMGEIIRPVYEEYPYLEGFNIYGWAKTYSNSINILVKSSEVNQQVKISWNDEIAKTNGKYCIRINLEDNRTEYMHRRSYVETFDSEEAEYRLQEFNKHIERFKQQNNPFCYTANKQFGPYNELLRLTMGKEKLYKVENAEMVSFDKTIKEVYQLASHYYAPINFLVNSKKEVLNISEMVPLITKPLELQSYLENWKNIEFKLDNEFYLHTLLTDEECDDFIRDMLSSKMRLFVDPMFDNNKTLIHAIEIIDQAQFLKEKER